MCNSGVGECQPILENYQLKLISDEIHIAEFCFYSLLRSSLKAQFADSSPWNIFALPFEFWQRQKESQLIAPADSCTLQSWMNACFLLRTSCNYSRLFAFSKPRLVFFLQWNSLYCILFLRPFELHWLLEDRFSISQRTVSNFMIGLFVITVIAIN